MNIAEWHPRSKNIVLNIKAEALLNQYNFIFQTTLRRFISILQTAQIFYWMMPALKIFFCWRNDQWKIWTASWIEFEIQFFCRECCRITSRTVVWIFKISANPSAFILKTTFFDLRDYSATFIKTLTLLLDYISSSSEHFFFVYLTTCSWIQ